MTNTSKQKKSNEEKQAKKELDSDAVGRVFGDKLDHTGVGEERPGNCTHSKFHGSVWVDFFVLLG